MKKIFCLAFVLFSAIGIFAQEKTIEQSEFDTVVRNSYRKFGGQSFRQTENFQNISPNGNLITSKSVTEFAARAGRHSFYEFDSSSLKTKRETITIGGKTYMRIGDGEWTDGKIEPASNPEDKPRIVLKTVDEQIEYKSLGTEILDTQNANVYAKIERKKLVNEANKSETLSTITTKFWIGDDGGVIKREMQIENHITSEKNPVESVYRDTRTTVWELDPNIKIEAPIIAK